jgi:hypothetical protein
VPGAPDRDILEAARRNQLLRQLPKQELEAILVRASVVQLEHRRLLYRDEAPVPVVYFPTTAVVSILVGAEDSAAVEIATVGNEGVVGAGAVLGVSRAIGRTVVQVAGESLTAPAREANRLLCELAAMSTSSGATCMPLFDRSAKPRRATACTAPKSVALAGSC